MRDANKEREANKVREVNIVREVRDSVTTYIGFILRGGDHSDRAKPKFLYPVMFSFNQTKLCTEEKYVEEIVFCC